MMTMPLDGLVKGGPPGGEVIGIVGYDIFRWVLAGCKWVGEPCSWKPCRQDLHLQDVIDRAELSCRKPDEEGAAVLLPAADGLED
jgi:hypothetical protein